MSSALIEFLKDHKDELEDNLYNSPHCCKAILRLLPPFAHQIVLRLLFTDDSFKISADVIKSWIQMPSDSQPSNEYRDQIFKAALTRTQSLRILCSELDSNNRTMYWLSTTFKHSLLQAIAPDSEGSLKENYLPKSHPNAPKISMLQKNALRWDKLLIAAAGLEDPSDSLKKILELSGLLIKGTISKKGCRLLLSNPNTQLWTFILSLVTTVSNSSLELIFRLADCPVGCGIDLSEYASIESFITTISDVGIAIFDRKSLSLWPTPVASYFSSTEQKSDGFVVVEPNFKVYAYTDSDLHFQILKQFLQIRARFPNMIVGTITPLSIRLGIVQSGLSAEDIIGFLERSAHPVRLKSSEVIDLARAEGDDSSETAHAPPIPANVKDQIELWEAEVYRVPSKKALFLKGFKNEEEWQSCYDFCSERDLLLWIPGKSRLFGNEKVDLRLVIRGDEEAVKIFHEGWVNAPDPDQDN